MKSASQKSEHVIIVPGGLLATRPHADPGCSVPPHEVDGDLAQDGQVARCRAIPDAAVILAEGDIEDPMESIFQSSSAGGSPGSAPWGHHRSLTGSSGSP